MDYAAGGDVISGLTWLLLIYTVPSEPSRKRAFIWREVKKVGALYLRDGVCILPQRAQTLAKFRAIAEKIEEFDGQATLVEAAHLSPERAALVMMTIGNARVDEYQEIKEAITELEQHIAREQEHRTFSYAELEELEGDLGKLRRWFEQVQARTYFPSQEPAEIEQLLGHCEQHLGGYLEQVYDRAVSKSS